MKTQKDIEKGCGKVLKNDEHGLQKCGMRGGVLGNMKLVLCPTCQTLLQQFKDFIEMIDKWFNKNSQVAEEQECKDLGIKRNGIISDLDIEELKSSIIGSEKK